MRDFMLHSIFLGSWEGAGRNERREETEEFKGFHVLISEQIPNIHKLLILISLFIFCNFLSYILHF